MKGGVIHGLAICSGVGGLELGVGLAAAGYRTVCHVEGEAYAAAVLAARMEDGALAPAPIWSDLRTFDGRPWRGVVDLVTAGYPCQPFSCAGRRAGEGDPRHLWPHVRRVIAETGPALVFCENVADHLSLGFDTVCSEMAGLGYRLESMAMEGLIPTPTSSMMTAQDMEQARFAGDDPRRPKYRDALLPTPTADERATGYVSGDGKWRPSLHKAARMGLIPTPTEGDSKGSGSRCTASSKAHAGTSLTDAVTGSNAGRAHGTGGKLHPRFVEWMMGWPRNWTRV